VNTKIFLIMITVVALLSVPIPVIAEEEAFIGLVPMTVEGLCIAVPNLPVAAVAVVSRPHEVAGGGIEYLCVATDAVIGTAEMMINGFGYGVWTAGTNLPVAAVAVATRPHELVGDSADFVLKCAGGILKYVFGP